MAANTERIQRPRAAGRITMTIASIILGGLGCSRVCKKQLDEIMGPKDVPSTTWYLKKVRLRTWDRFPVIVKIEGRALRTKKGVKVWVGWIPGSEGEKSKFHELVLCPGGDRTEILEDGRDGLVALHERREEAAAAVKATTGSRNRNKLAEGDGG